MMDVLKDVFMYAMTCAFAIVMFVYKDQKSSISKLGARVGNVETANAVLEKSIESTQDNLNELKKESHQIAMTITEVYQTLTSMKVSLGKMETSIEYLTAQRQQQK